MSEPKPRVTVASARREIEALLATHEKTRHPEGSPGAHQVEGFKGGLKYALRVLNGEEPKYTAPAKRGKR
jgi:hypothetical protein